MSPDRRKDLICNFLRGSKTFTGCTVTPNDELEHPNEVKLDFTNQQVIFTRALPSAVPTAAMNRLAVDLSAFTKIAFVNGTMIAKGSTFEVAIPPLRNQDRLIIHGRGMQGLQPVSIARSRLRARTLQPSRR